MWAAGSGLLQATTHLADAMQDQQYDFNAKDKAGKSALTYAVEGFHINTVKLMLEGKYRESISEETIAEALTKAEAMKRLINAQIDVKTAPLMQSYKAEVLREAGSVRLSDQ